MAEILRSSRRATKLYVANNINTCNLVKFTKHAKFLGNGLAVIDFGSRVGKIHNAYQGGRNWEREMFVSFVASAGIGIAAIKAGSAALSFLAMAPPIGWLGLVVGGIAIAGVAAAASMTLNSEVQKRGGSVYDAIMSSLRIR